MSEVPLFLYVFNTPFQMVPGSRVEVAVIDSCITQLKAQGPSRTCNENTEEEEVAVLGQEPVSLSSERGTYKTVKARFLP